MDRKQMGRQIADRRAACGMRPEELARKAGVNPRKLAKWESGRRWPERRRLEALGSALGIPVGELLGGKDEAETERLLAAYAARERRARVLWAAGWVLLAAGAALGVCAAPGVAIALVLWQMGTPGTAGDIGIIGGADGPTAILVSDTRFSAGDILWFLLPAVLLILGILLLAIARRDR